MVWLRNILLVGIAIVGYLLILEWQADYGSRELSADMQAVKSKSLIDVASSVSKDDSAGVNVTPLLSQDVPASAQDEFITSSKVTSADEEHNSNVIIVQTEHLLVSIDLVGGDIVKAELPRYPQYLGKDSQPFLLMDRSPRLYYVAQSGFAGRDGLDVKGRPLYTLEPGPLSMKADQKELVVTLRAASSDGVIHRKQFTFKKDRYDIDVRFSVTNDSQVPWKGTVFAQIKRNEVGDVSDSSFGQYTFLGGAYYESPDRPYNKLKLDEICANCVNASIAGGWIAMIQHYFMSAWVPRIDGQVDYRTDYVNNQFRILGFQTPQRLIEPGKSSNWDVTFYAGPKIKSELKPIAPGLELAVDYGPLFILSEFFFDILDILTHGIKGWSGFGNWGLSIVILTLIIKAVLWPLSAKAYRSMAQMRKLQPRITRLKEQYGEDRQLMSQKMMELYKNERINPLGGCLPMLIQMPIFLAFYWMLLESVELRQAPFFGWIKDLSVKDPYFALPILMGVTMYMQQLLSPAPIDPVQAKVMRIMPIAMTALFMFFPAGVVLYWCCSNLVSIAQQWFITRAVEGDSKSH